MYCQEMRMNNVANKVAYVTTILGSNIFVVDFMVHKSGYGTKHMRFYFYALLIVPLWCGADETHLSLHRFKLTFLHAYFFSHSSDRLFPSGALFQFRKNTRRLVDVKHLLPTQMCCR